MVGETTNEAPAIELRGLRRRFGETVALDPQEYVCWLRKDSCHQWLGQFDKALDAYRQAQKLRPDDLDANLWIARVHWLRREWGEALPWLERAHEIAGRTGSTQYPTGLFVEQVRAWKEIQPRLPRILSGDEEPADATESRRVA